MILTRETYSEHIGLQDILKVYAYIDYKLRKNYIVYRCIVVIKLIKHFQNYLLLILKLYYNICI